MKRVFTLIGCALLAWSAAAQNSWQDALLFAENQYGGTARSVGMGEALTAIGGDLGSLTFNPAGSAVPSYSQIAFTGGLSYNLAVAQGDGSGSGFGDPVKTGYLRAKMPNIGFTMNMDTGRRHGLKRMSFSFLSNSTADYTLRMNASGVNANNSYAGAVASSAAGYPESALASGGWYTLDDNAASYGLLWRDIAAYRSGIIGTINGQMVGLTDWIKGNGETAPLGSLRQQYGFQSKGYKHDMLLNWALDFSDVFYVGANIGLVTMAYGQSEYWYEAPESAAEFPDVPFEENEHARFQSLQMKSVYEAKGSGVYFKLGMLWRPVAGLRLGAAIQTPTIMNITTRPGDYAEAHVDGVRLTPCQTPDDAQDTFSFVSPFRVNGGLAYSFGNVAVLSADYEGVNYGMSYFQPRSENVDFYTSNPYVDTNADIKDVLGWSHMARVGLEVKPVPFLALRAGYNLTTSGQHSFLEWVDGGDGKEYLRVFELTAQERASLMKHAFSLGVGFSSSGSFYADAALRYRLVPSDTFVPYTYYTYDTQSANRFAYQEKVEDTNPLLQCAAIRANYYPIEAMLTVGWRF